MGASGEAVTAWLQYVLGGGDETPQVAAGMLIVADTFDSIRYIARFYGKKG